METSFWRRWCNPPRSARPRRQPLVLEALEDRVTPALTPQMVLDINTDGLSSEPSGMVTIDSTIYFEADDGVHGRELWKTDGTAAGTLLVKDINPGSAGSSPGYLTNVNGVLFFTANDATNGQELWKSDGTAAGTVLVKDIQSGIGGSDPFSFTNVNGTLFFTAHDGVHRYELWKSDGTAAGTVLVKDIAPGSTGSNPSSLTNVNGTLFFYATDVTHGHELWKSDGTAAGTTLVKDIRPGSATAYLADLTAVGGTLFFSANDGTNGRELWKSNGTAGGTTLVKNIRPGNAGSEPGSLTLVNGTLFFSADDGSNGRELWRSDGTAAGTTLVKDIFPGVSPGPYEDEINSSAPRYLANVNGTLFFYADGGTNGQGLWKSDGTSAGTTLVKDIGARYLTDVNGTLFFSASDGTHGAELWKSDGTALGTVLARDIAPGSAGSDPRNLTNLNGMLFCSAYDHSVLGYELWKSDGTTAGTVLVKDINTSTFGSFPGNMTDVNGTLFFTADDGTNGLELWKSDGTADGTTLVKDIFPGVSPGPFGDVINSSAPRYLTDVNGTLFFTANDGTNGRELWKSDGTAAGTVLVKDIRSGSGGSVPYSLTNVNGTLFFSANDGTNGWELWKSDGTEAGTVLVKDIGSGSASAYPGSLTNVNGTLFFTASESSSGRELWKSDGTEAGTALVKDINPGSASPNLDGLTAVNGTLFFSADDTNGRELWKSDGTADGTTLVKDIFPGTYIGYYGGEYPYSSSPSNLTNVNGTLFFTAAGTNGSELYKSDGTADGTTLVKDINPGGWSDPTPLSNVNGTLFFTAEDGTNGRELWKSDGTAAGTVLVKDINPGSASSTPTSLTNVSGTLFFTASDGAGVSGKLWQSDGTAAGTALVADLVSGSLTNVNGTLFFAADEGIHGRELWVLVDDVSQGTSLDVGGFPATITAGVAGTFTVTAKNPDGSTNTSYRGTVHFTSSDPQAVLPGDYTFTETDQGAHTFTATLKTVGSQSLTAGDTAVPGVAGTQTGITVTPAPTSSFTVGGFPSSVTAGVAGSFTVTAKNADCTTNTGYVGTVHFTSSDPQAVLPAEYTFTAADQGVHTFTATLKTAGSQSLTVGDTVDSSGAGTQTGITVNPAAASRFVVDGFPSPVSAGVAGSFTVTAQDAYGNRATGYTGTVRFTSSDAKATLPGDYTFTAADAGIRSFIAVLRTAGTRSLTATDAANAAVAGAQSVTVNPAAASRLVLSAPASVKANVKFNLTVIIMDAFGNVVTGYRGTLAFRSSDATARLPRNYTFTAADQGAHTFPALVLKKKGNQTIRVTDTLDSSLTASVLIEVR